MVGVFRKHINKINIKTLYIEHKLRSIIGRNYPSVWIKKDKIESIIKDYGAFLFVSECKDDIYYIWNYIPYIVY